MTSEPAAVREAAVGLLARREHSRRELKTKLGRRGWPAAAIEPVLDQLAEDGLQSDRRFAEGYARQRAGKNYGPVRIRAELGERGIERGLVAGVLAELNVDWAERAAVWYERRYGAGPPADRTEKSRRMQALQRRGFAFEHIRKLFE